MGSPYWPLFDLRITTPRVELRPPTDEDLFALASLAAAGVHDPDFMPFAIPWTEGGPEAAAAIHAPVQLAHPRRLEARGVASVTRHRGRR